MDDGPLIFQKIFGDAGRLFTVISGIANILSTFQVSTWSIVLVGMLLRSAGWPLWATSVSVDQAVVSATLAICGFILSFAPGWGGMACARSCGQA